MVKRSTSGPLHTGHWLALAVGLLLVSCGETDRPSAPQLPTPPPGFALVRSGSFVMGSPIDELGHDCHETQHRVTLTKHLFVLDHEVTQDEWAAVLGWNESLVAGSDLPVTMVTWYDAVEYCIELSALEGLSLAYSLSDTSMSGVHIVEGRAEWHRNATGYRLLTEAEWEYACRAGSQTAFCNGPIVTIFCPPPANPTLDEVAWYCIQHPHSVKTKAPNAWGIYDMHGNVAEWCWDLSSRREYGPDPITDPTGAESGEWRVFRSGSTGPNYCRSAWRGIALPSNVDAWRGVRIARMAS